jgi:putative oxidoreductase
MKRIQGKRMASSSIASSRSSGAPKLIIPALAGFYEWAEPYSYLLMRIAVGLTLLPIGWNKLLGGLGPVVATMAKYGIAPSAPAAFCVVAIESVGGVCIALGLLTRFWAAAFAIEMAVISTIKMPSGYFPMQPFLLLGILAFCVALKGGGRFSLDRALGWEL